MSYPETIASADHSPSLRDAIDEAAHALPQQGPLAVFIHHNTLHALGHLPFHEAIARSSAETETQGYLTEAQFRDAFARGRIDEDDLRAALDERSPAHSGGDLPLVGRRALWMIALMHPLPVLSDAQLEWQLVESRALDRMRSDVPPSARQSFLDRTSRWLRSREAAGELDSLVIERPSASLEQDPQAWALAALWKICRTVRSRVEAPASIADRVPNERSHRDLLLATTGVDPAALVNPWLVRFCGAFLDHGMAHWPMPGRERGLLACFRDHVLTPGVPLPIVLRPARALVREQLRRGLDAEATVLDALDELGVAPAQRAAYLTRVLLALPGWAGMVRRLETHPEEADPHARPPSLLELLAIRLTLDRIADAHVARVQLGYTGSLAGLPAFARGLCPPARPDAPSADEAAFRLFGVCQLAAITPGELAAASSSERQSIVDTLDELDEMARRRVWQEAYERHYREEILQAMAETRARSGPNAPNAPEAPARWQVAFCIDDREESIRRHLEELAPEVETFGVAGFFGLAIDYVGLDGRHPAPLCPLGVVPAHVVEEVPEPEHETWADRRLARRGALARLMHASSRSTHGLFRGVLLTPVFGLLAAFPLVSRLLFPGLTESLRRRTAQLFLPAPRTRLTEERASERDTAHGKPRGFTLEEQTDRVAGTLRSMGLVRRFAPIVAILGHGSVSLNNPHESAHDCGACGGRHGSPNARLFARLANRTDVRAALRERGIDIPDTTIFVGGSHNTANDEVGWFDTDRLPASHQAELEGLRAALDRARAWDAHERCRRFANVPLDVTPEQALRHVRGRSSDLSQPRPEYGHATNAICVVGRRALTRGLFLDRRALLVSYDPTIDAGGSVLARLLAAVGPVGAGINLEYYFSVVDNDRYGCGTKLPHNITGLLGVMDGHSSDLRTGLPWEMVEIHEPVRLLTIVESTPEILLEIAASEPSVGQLIQGGWIQLVCVRPDDGRMSRFVPSRGAFEPWTPQPPGLREVAYSADHYRGQRGFLPVVRVLAADHRARVEHAA